MKPGLDLKQDFLVDYKTDPYEKKNASAGNEKIVKALYEVALKYDTITPCIPVSYTHLLSSCRGKAI